MARSFISIGAGGPRVGVVLGRRDMARFFAVLAIPFGLLALFGGATDLYGDGLGRGSARSTAPLTHQSSVSTRSKPHSWRRQRRLGPST
jgi:hypothetical protein